MYNLFTDPHKFARSLHDAGFRGLGSSFGLGSGFKTLLGFFRVLHLETYTFKGFGPVNSIDCQDARSLAVQFLERDVETSSGEIGKLYEILTHNYNIILPKEAPVFSRVAV